MIGINQKLYGKQNTDKALSLKIKLQKNIIHPLFLLNFFAYLSVELYIYLKNVQLRQKQYKKG